ncbi:SurA N-terminal domain-containing protein [Tindallia californiensis]|uniref:SurA N-terminal domain-containing protein n=1 Tax=Tindallia californiensis TaxID=159292 RepID=A0A1H3MIF6_9FIRM|nr:SurA N-terminal domain-containing protein [Tindallia californiensis]SDY76461.1 SurA N-terminal domain-containing protein [Tindallia californiensis]
MKQKKKILLLLTLVLLLIITACVNSEGIDEESEETQEDLGEVVAIVNGENIYELVFQRQVDRLISANEQQGMSFEGEEGEMVKAQIEDQVMDYLLQQEVLLQEAGSRQLKASEEEIDEEMKMIRDQFETEEAYEQALEDNLFTEEELRNTLKAELTIETLLESESPEIEIDEEEIQEYYNFYEMQHEQQMAMIQQEGTELSDEEMEMMKLPSYEEMEEDLRQQIIMQKQQEYHMLLVEELMENSEIEILI